MGAQLLILAGILLLGACAGDGTPPRRVHDSLACASCHAGSAPAKGVAAVPDASCTSAGCHADHGPLQVEWGAVRFTHRDHGRSELDAPHGCAGCHSHVPDSTLLAASPDACILCHREDVFDPQRHDCAICHGEVGHTAASSQGVELPHAWLRADAQTCLRCHYDVGASKSDLSSQRCLACHDSAERQLRLGAGVDLHPLHVGFSCLRCHGPTEHRIRAMSSAVELECASCHSGHRPGSLVPAASDTPCGDCHPGEHADQQRLLLGWFEGAGTNRPDSMFMAGLNCTSCHVQRDARPEAATCVACHEDSYGRILDWWREGLSERGTRLRAALASARTELPQEGAALDAAAERLRLVEQGGGHHNLQFADALLREALATITAARDRAGRPDPQLPDLGSPPRRGFCSSCHYAWEPSERFVAPPTASHERYLRSSPED